MITVSRPVVKVEPYYEYEHLLGEDNKVISFGSINETLEYFWEHNYKFSELLELNYNIEDNE